MVTSHINTYEIASSFNMFLDLVWNLKNGCAEFYSFDCSLRFYYHSLLDTLYLYLCKTINLFVALTTLSLNDLIKC